MAENQLQLAAQLCRCQTEIMALLRQTSRRDERAGRLAELLRERIPGVAAAACLLSGPGSEERAVRPENGPIGSEQIGFVRSLPGASEAPDHGVQTLPHTASPDGQRLLVAAIAEDGRQRGSLLIALPATSSVEEISLAEALLTVSARTAALCWELEASRAERAELMRFALIGQAFIGLTHDLNNALNSMMLQSSVVQMRVDEQARNDLASVRQHGIQAAAMVRSLQHVVQERRAISYSVDLNAVVADVLEEEAELRGRVSVHFAAEAPQIQSVNSAVKQLVHLVLEGMCARSASPLQLRTEKREDGAALSVAIAEETDSSSADRVLWKHLDDVARQAGQSLLRQMGGTLSVERRSDGGQLLRIHWGSASRAQSQPEA